MGNVVLRARRLASVFYETGLGRGDVELGEMNGIGGGVSSVVLRVISKGDRTETSRIVGSDTLVPSSGELDVANWDRSEVGGSMESTNFFVKLNVFSYLSHVDCGINGVVEIPQKVIGRGYTSESRMINSW